MNLEKTKEVPKMYNHQEEALQFILPKNYFALFMEQGTGKSKVVIEKAYSLWNAQEIDCVIIISPNAVKEQWVTEQFPEHYPSEKWYGIVWQGKEPKAFQQEFVRAGRDKKNLFVFSINVEAFQAKRIDKYVEALIEDRKLMVIVDESTRIKNGRRKPRRGKRKGAKRTNKILDYFKDVTHKCILTGTPTPNSPFDLWSQFEFLRRDYFEKDFFYFKHHYGILIQKATQEGRRYTTVLDEKSYAIIKHKLKQFPKLSHSILEDLAAANRMKVSDIITINKMEKYTGYKNLKELKDRISRVTFFVKKQDCLDLPDKVYEKLYCEMKGTQKKLYNDLKKQMYAEFSGKEITVVNKVVMVLRLQMIAGGLFPCTDTDIKLDKDGNEYFDSVYTYEPLEDNCKMSVLLGDLEEVSKDTQIIIWARFRGEIDLIVNNLRENGYSCRRYYGGSKYEVIDQFKRNEFRILVGNPQKGGEGLNLQNATLHYYYSNSFKADSRLQSEDRSHRIGQTNKVTYKDLICKKTVDERIYQILKNKEDLINYFRTKGIGEFLK